MIDCKTDCIDSTINAPKPMGCFKDNWQRDLRNLIGYNLSFDECVEKANENNYYYIGLQAGNECWGDINIGLFEQVEYEECTMPCSYDKSKDCGGAWRNLVFDLRQIDAASKAYCGISTPIDCTLKAGYDPID